MTIEDGIYFIADETWTAIKVKDGENVDQTSQSLYEIHLKARDRWAGIAPSDRDERITDPQLAQAIVDLDEEGLDATLLSVSRYVERR